VRFVVHEVALGRGFSPIASVHSSCGSGPLGRYSDSLRAGRSAGLIPVWVRFSAPVQTGPGSHPAFYTMGIGSFPGVKRPARGVDHPPQPVLRLSKSRAIPLLPLRAFVACSRLDCTFDVCFGSPMSVSTSAPCSSSS